MRWRTERRSRNVEDRRGRPVRRGAAVGGLGLVVIIGLALLFGVDPMQLLQQLPVDGGPGAGGGAPAARDAASDEMTEFVRAVLGSTEDTWSVLLPEQVGRRYEEPTLVLFTGNVQSACGFAQAAMGPFYCPADRKVYIDLSFYADLKSKLGAPGDFAQAYVIAHEVGHHIQNLLGTSDRVHAQRGRVSEAEYNELSVRLELQADFLAGVWAHHADKLRGILEPNDLEEALNAAEAIGDDRLQYRARGYVVPESFTHGTSEQRQRWFRKGFETGDFRQGDTFSAREL